MDDLPEELLDRIASLLGYTQERHSSWHKEIWHLRNFSIVCRKLYRICQPHMYHAIFVIFYQNRIVSPLAQTLRDRPQLGKCIKVIQASHRGGALGMRLSSEEYDARRAFLNSTTRLSPNLEHLDVTAIFRDEKVYKRIWLEVLSLSESDAQYGSVAPVETCLNLRSIKFDAYGLDLIIFWPLFKLDQLDNLHIENARFADSHHYPLLSRDNQIRKWPSATSSVRTIRLIDTTSRYGDMREMPLILDVCFAIEDFAFVNPVQQGYRADVYVWLASLLRRHFSQGSLPRLELWDHGNVCSAWAPDGFHGNIQPLRNAPGLQTLCVPL